MKGSQYLVAAKRKLTRKINPPKSQQNIQNRFDDTESYIKLATQKNPSGTENQANTLISNFNTYDSNPVNNTQISKPLTTKLNGRLKVWYYSTAQYKHTRQRTEFMNNRTQDCCSC